MASSLPNEVLEEILSFLPSDDHSSIATLIACTLVSKRLSAVAKSNIVWAHHLNAWTDAKRSLPSASELGGAAYYRLRFQYDQEAASCIRALACATHGRTDTIAKLVSLGLNVADRLRKTVERAEERAPEEWIALRYWSRTALGIILRAAALETWSRIGDEEDVPSLFDSLGAFSVHKGASPAKLERLVTSMRRDVVNSSHQLDHVDSFTHLSHVCVYVWMGLIRFAKQQGSDPFLHETLDDSLPFVPRDFLAEATNPTQSKGWASLLIVATFSALVNSLPAEWDVEAQVVNSNRLVRLARRSSSKEESDWFYLSGPPPLGLLSRSAVVKILTAAPLLSDVDTDLLSVESIAAITARHAARDITLHVLATPPSPDRGAIHFAALAMYLLLALPSDTAAPVHVILYRETQQSFPFDVGVVQQYLLPRCHEDATAEARAICEAILDVEESAPLGMPDLEVWEKEPDYQVGEMLARVSPGGAASILVVCRCWQQEEENYFSDDESEEEYVKIQIWYLLLNAAGETVEVEEGLVGAVTVCTPEQVREIELGVETGKYFRARAGERLVLSAWLEAAYPVKRQ